MNITENDLEQLKSVATGRLRPNNLIGSLWGMLIFSSVALGVSYFGVSQYPGPVEPWLDGMLKVFLALLILQFIITLFLSSEKSVFRFQKLQIIALCAISLKFSIDLYPFFFVFSSVSEAPSSVMIGGFLLLITGFIFLIISIIRAYSRVKKGELKKGGQGLYQFSESKGYVSLPFIFALTMIGGIVGRNFSDTSFGMIVILLISAVIQFGVAMAWPEFLLIAQAKRKFPSFIVKTPKRLSE